MWGRHDQLHHPITKFHICRLGEGQRMNRFLIMQYMARKNPLAKRLARLQVSGLKLLVYEALSY